MTKKMENSVCYIYMSKNNWLYVSNTSDVHGYIHITKTLIWLYMYNHSFVRLIVVLSYISHMGDI
jgi:hypothetical protein